MEEMKDGNQTEAMPTISPENIARVQKALAEMIDAMVELFREIARKITKAFEATKKVAKAACNDFIDGLLYAANDHPRWWHLYKHAKKARTRKKYRRLLFLQLIEKTREGAPIGGEAT